MRSVSVGEEFLRAAAGYFLQRQNRLTSAVASQRAGLGRSGLVSPNLFNSKLRTCRAACCEPPGSSCPQVPAPPPPAAAPRCPAAWSSGRQVRGKQSRLPLTDHPLWPLTLDCRWQVDLQCSPAMWPAMWRATCGREGRWGGRLALGWQMHHTSKPSNSGAQPLAPLAFSDP